MKICYLSNSATPSHNASSLQIVRMCDAFAKLGHKVTLICPDTSKTNESVFSYYGLNKNFEFLKLIFFKKFPIGINYYLYSIFSVIFCLNKNYDLFITRNFFTAFCLIFLRKKLIFELHHSLELESRSSIILLRLFKFLNSTKVFKIVAISEAIKDYYVRNFNIYIKKIIVLPSGSNLKINYFFKKKIRFDIGYFGLIEKKKSFDLISRVAKIDRENNYHLYGNILGNLKKNNYKNLKIYNYIPYKDIKEAYSKMDILILPYSKVVPVAGGVGNIIDFTSPLKLFDYMAAGKLIIASNIPVLREVLKNNVNCIFINNFNNPNSWRLELFKLKNNIYKRKIISKKSYINSKKFTLIKRASLYLKD